MHEEVKERLEMLATSDFLLKKTPYGGYIRAALDEIKKLETKTEAMKIVLSAVAAKADVSQDKFMKLLSEAENQIKETTKEKK